jgi:flagellar assembly protein FliH
MAAKFIPVEELTDYQPWHFAGIEQDQPVNEITSLEAESEFQQEIDTEEPEDAEPAEPALQAPSAEDIGRIYHDAHREGYEAGLVEGLEAGHAEGFEIGHAEGLEAGQKKGYEQAVAEAKPLAELFSGFAKAAEAAQQEIGQDVIRLAFDIARQMLREALKANPAVVLTVVQAAIESMPQGIQHPHIHLHPDDAVLVRNFLKDELPHAGWKVMEDHRVERGGCRIECATAELDATLPTRWKRIAAALGQDHSWLENER